MNTERPWVIDRPRLLGAIEGSPGSVVVLEAPAGYGKSTLARQWLRRSEVGGTEHGTVWYQCLPAASDAIRLASSLAEAAARGLDGGLNVEPFLRKIRGNRAASAHGRHLADVLLEQVSGSPPLKVVVDDYQLLSHDPQAEEFLGTFLLGVGWPTLVTTRVRPIWLTAQRVMYGDVWSLDARDLAFTHDEAIRVLTAGDALDMSELLPLTDGWPALVSLAILGSPTNRVVRGALEEFLSKEVYDALPSDVRDHVVILAALAAFDEELAVAILGRTAAQKATDIGGRAGLITRNSSGRYELHPVFKQFLCDLPPSRKRTEVAEACCDTLVARSCWDELFALAQRFESEVLWRALIEHGVRPALTEGRIPSVRRWVEQARGRAIEGLPLVDAELALRDGLYLRAETIAANAVAAQSMPTNLRYWAYSIAGGAAHLGGRETQAVDFYRLAHDHADNDTDRRAAAWGELKAAVDLELPEAKELLERIRSVPLIAPEDQVELAARTLVLNARFGSLHGLDEMKAVLQLLSLVDNPFARNSFRNIYAYACAIAGMYDESSQAVDELEADAAESELHFAQSYIALTRAVVAIATGAIDAGLALLIESATEARRTGDVHVAASCAATKARALIAIGRFDDAAAVASYDHRALIRSMRGELLATRSLAVVCSGGSDEALELATAAESLSGAVEVPVTVACVRAIHACRNELPDIQARVTACVAAARAGNYVDGFIAAYRGYPDLSRRLAVSADHRDWLSRVMTRANDRALIRVAGLGAQGGANSLTRREAEVFALLRMGHSNKQIGAALYITEGTAKAHVQKILDKLGAKSRTEAAMMAPVQPYPKQPREVAARGGRRAPGAEA